MNSVLHPLPEGCSQAVVVLNRLSLVHMTKVEFPQLSRWRHHLDLIAHIEKRCRGLACRSFLSCFPWRSFAFSITVVKVILLVRIGCMFQLGASAVIAFRLQRFAQIISWRD